MDRTAHTIKTGMRALAALAVAAALTSALGCATGVANKPDIAYLSLDTNPQGAKIYQGGELRGTTPYGKDARGYGIDPSHREAGVYTTAPYTFKKDGYLPVSIQYHLRLEPAGARNFRFQDKITLTPATEEAPAAPEPGGPGSVLKTLSPNKTWLPLR